MATRFFLRNTTANTAGYAGTEKSTALPVGTLDDAGNGARDLETTKGTTQTSVSNVSLAQGTDQDQYMGKWISDPLTGISQIDANTWTLAVATLEGNNNANAFTVASVYVLKSDDTVRGFVYDSHTSLGVEYLTTEDGQVLSLTGSAVTGVVSTDRLCVEVWIHAVQSMAVSYTNTLYFDGTTDVVDSTTTDAASYLETPQNGLFSSGTVVTPAAIAIVAALPTPSPLAASVVTPAAVALAAALPAASVLAASRVEPVTVALVAALPNPTTPTIVTPAAIAIVAALPGPTVLGAASVTPAVVAITGALPTPSALAASLVSPAVVALVAALPAPTVLAASTVGPAAVALTNTLPTPAPLAGAVVTPATIAIGAAFPAPAALAAAVVAPATVPLTSSYPTPTVSSAGATIVSPATVAIVAGFPAAALIFGAPTLTPATIAIRLTVPQLVAWSPPRTMPATVLNRLDGRTATRSLPGTTVHRT